MLLRLTAAGIVFAALASSALAGEIIRDGDSWTETRQGVLAAGPEANLKIVSRGPVTLTSDGGGQFLYTVRLRVRAASAEAARQLFAAARFSARPAGPWTYLDFAAPPGGASVELIVRAPRQLRRAIVETEFGAIDAQGLASELTLSTGGGQVSADRIGGALTILTGGGDIRIGSAGGALRATSRAGAIHVREAGAAAWLETAGGEISVGSASGPLEASAFGGNISVDRAEAGVTARTTGGLITVNQSAGDVQAETASGGIRIANARGVHCVSTAGSVHLRQVTGPLNVVTNAGAVAAELAPSAAFAASSLTAGSGDITVWIPASLGLNVKALAAGPGATARVVSEFPEVTPASARGPATQPIAVGSLNGGGQVLQLATARGVIYLRRR